MKQPKMFDLISEASLEQLQTLVFRKRLVKDHQQCKYCSINMCLKNNSRALDGVDWRCMNTKCKKYRTSLSFRSGSWLNNYNTPLRVILKAIFCISINYQNYEILKIVSIDRNVLIKLKKEIITRMKQFFKENPIKLGGPGVIVQIDETKLNLGVKGHKGRYVENSWAFCIVDTSFSPALGYVTLVDDRKSATLLKIIDNIILPGSTIHSDEWAAYKSLALSHHYVHKTVCHKDYFVDPHSGVHTQHVESYNNRLKSRIKAMRGLNKTQREEYLIEFMFKERHTKNTFNAILNLLKLYFFNHFPKLTSGYQIDLMEFW